MNKDIVITGLGSVSPAGSGKEALFAAFRNRVPGIRKIAGFAAPGGESLAGGVYDFTADDYIKDKKFRRVADVTRYAIAAAGMAFKDASSTVTDYPPGRIGLIMCITHGAIGYSSRFHRELMHEGPRAASPLLFSDSVLNAPAGNLSNYFGIRGPIHTLIGGSAAGIDAVKLACELLLSGRLDCCLVGAAEELNEISYHTYARFGFGFSAGEGAAMLLLEKKAGAMERRRRQYAAVGGTASGFFAGDFAGNSGERSLPRVIGKSIERAGLSIADITDVFINSGEEAVKNYFASEGSGEGSGPGIENLAGLMGEAFCVTTFFHIIAASMIISGGSSATGNTLVGALSVEGHAASLVLSGIPMNKG